MMFLRRLPSQDTKLPASCYFIRMGEAEASALGNKPAARPRSIDIRVRTRTLPGAAYAWRLAGLILGAEERGNQLSDGLPPSGVNPARSW